MKFDGSTRAKFAVSLFVVLTLGSGLNHLYQDVILLPHGEDKISLTESRYQELQKLLPKQGTVGFLGHTDPMHFPEFRIAQYVLAPLVLSSSMDEDLVIADFPDNRSARKPPDHHELVRDFGNGVALFKAVSR